MNSNDHNRVPVIAVIEDVDALREFLTLAMTASGFQARGYASAEAFYRDAVARPADIVLIDLGLPGEDGLSAIRHLRQLKSLGIIVVTGRGTDDDRVAGMTAGADYYLVKPVERSELVRAVETLWKSRHGRWLGDTGVHWQFDRLHSRLVTPGGKIVKLSASEALLMDCLTETPGEVIDKAKLYTRLFPDEDDISYHRVEVLLSRLRKKLREHEAVFPLRSVFGKGIAFTGQIKVINRMG